jgi:iron complex outermembrane receptor protein
MVRGLLVIGFLFTLTAKAQEPDDLAGLQQLMKQEVFSVGKKPQRLDRAAAAVYVISQEDIRRSGVTSIVEALRLAPGVSVTRLNGNVWTVGIRGFNTLTSDKLLVLLDGRTVYSPLFAGVFWDAVTTPLEDIERIEVVRGPAAATWGANAVNGVVNVITKRPETTQGALASVTTGSEDWLVAHYRYGGRASNGANYRLYGSQNYRLQPSLPSRGFAQDSWNSVQGGFRMDHAMSDTTSASLQGDMYRIGGGMLMQFSPIAERKEIGAKGGNFLGRWMHLDRWGGNTTIQSSFDWNRRETGILPSEVGALDVDAQYRRRVLPRHEVQLGVGVRHVNDKTEPRLGISFDPAAAQYDTYGLSAVDEITLIPDELLVTAGLRADRMWVGTWSVQPTARILWIPATGRSVWASVSRAARVLTRYDADFPRVESVEASRRVRPESSVSSEIGFRNRFTKRLSVDIATFRTLYTDLLDFPAPLSDPSIRLPAAPAPIRKQNLWSGLSYGGEAVLIGEVSDRWRITASVSAMRLRLKQPAAPWGTDTSQPRLQWQIQSRKDLTRRLQADIALYGSTQRSDTLYTQARATSSGPVPGRLRVDARLGWLLGETCDVSFGIRDALVPRSLEYSSEFAIVTTGVRRNVFVTLRWRL